MAKTVSYLKLQNIIIDTLKKLGIEDIHAKTVAEILISADLRGIESHGIARLSIYSRRIKAGLINPHPKINIISESANMALIDADNGLGHVAAKFAMQKCMEKAEQSDIAIVGIKNTNHFGIGAYYAMMATEKDLIGFVATNTSPLMAPFGGCEALLGTNPFAVAIPAGNEPPIVLDMATSLVPRGKIEIYQRKGLKLPLDWAIDEEGNPTDNPEKALKGTLLPVGGPKGYGMAVAIDILSGIMMGASYSSGVGSLFGNFSKPQNIGSIMMAINIKNFMPVNEFKTKVDGYIKTIKGSKKAKGVNEIFLPGEIEYKRTSERRENGIPVNDVVIKELDELLKSIGLSLEAYI